MEVFGKDVGMVLSMLMHILESFSFCFSFMVHLHNRSDWMCALVWNDVSDTSSRSLSFLVLRFPTRVQSSAEEGCQSSNCLIYDPTNRSFIHKTFDRILFQIQFRNRRKNSLVKRNRIEREIEEIEE